MATKRAAARVAVFVGASMDGFIARENGDLDWLQGSDGPAVDYGFNAFFSRIDALVMGRKTFETVRTFEEWPYGTKPVVVLTHRPLRIPKNLSATVESMEGPPAAIVERLSRRGLVRLYVDGGRTIQAFLAAGLVDELTVSRLPILIGKGIPLFGPVPRDIQLRHISTHTFPGGMVQSTYEVERRPGQPAYRKKRGAPGARDPAGAIRVR